LVVDVKSHKLSNFINRHKNTPAVIVGSASDISNFPFNSFRGLVFGMGDSPLRGINLFQTDYWVFANAHWLRPWIQRDSEAIRYINPKKTFIATAIFAFQEPKTVRQKLEKALREVGDGLVFFDQRHSQLKASCYPSQGCCVARNLLGIESTVQELLSKEFNQISHYSEGATVAVHTLALAILMGCNPISVVGVKIPRLSNDYTYYSTPEAEKLVKTFGSMGPFVESDQNLVWAQMVHNARSLAKTAYETLQSNFPLPIRERLNVRDSIFAPDRIQIKTDFEFMISNFLQIGGEIRNYSKNSLLSDIEGVLNVDFVCK
jgi:hypothetical protein